MTATNVAVCMDEHLKKPAVGQQNKVPFEIVADPFYSAINQARLRQAIAELEAGKGELHELIEVADE